MVEQCHKHNPEVACWTDDGRAFIVKDDSFFSQSYIPKYFNHSNFPSFVRQLNLYGFRSSKSDPDDPDDEGFAEDGGAKKKKTKKKSKSKKTTNTSKNEPQKKKRSRPHMKFWNDDFRRGERCLLYRIQRSKSGDRATKKARDDDVLRHLSSSIEKLHRRVEEDVALLNKKLDRVLRHLLVEEEDEENGDKVAVCGVKRPRRSKEWSGKRREEVVGGEQQPLKEIHPCSNFEVGSGNDGNSILNMAITNPMTVGMNITASTHTSKGQQGGNNADNCRSSSTTTMDDDEFVNMMLGGNDEASQPPMIPQQDDLADYEHNQNDREQEKNSLPPPYYDGAIEPSPLSSHQTDLSSALEATEVSVSPTTSKTTLNDKRWENASTENPATDTSAATTTTTTTATTNFDDCCSSPFLPPPSPPQPSHELLQLDGHSDLDDATMTTTHHNHHPGHYTDSSSLLPPPPPPPPLLTTGKVGQLVGNGNVPSSESYSDASDSSSHGGSKSRSRGGAPKGDIPSTNNQQLQGVPPPRRGMAPSALRKRAFLLSTCMLAVISANILMTRQYYPQRSIDSLMAHQQASGMRNTMVSISSAVPPRRNSFDSDFSEDPLQETDKRGEGGLPSLDAETILMGQNLDTPFPPSSTSHDLVITDDGRQDHGGNPLRRFLDRAPSASPSSPPTLTSTTKRGGGSETLTTKTDSSHTTKKTHHGRKKQQQQQQQQRGSSSSSMGVDTGRQYYGPSSRSSLPPTPTPRTTGHHRYRYT